MLRFPDPFRTGGFIEIKSPYSVLLMQHQGDEERQKRCPVCRHLRAELAKQELAPTGFALKESD